MTSYQETAPHSDPLTGFVVMLRSMAERFDRKGVLRVAWLAIRFAWRMKEMHAKNRAALGQAQKQFERCTACASGSRGECLSSLTDTLGEGLDMMSEVIGALNTLPSPSPLDRLVHDYEQIYSEWEALYEDYLILSDPDAAEAYRAALEGVENDEDREDIRSLFAGRIEVARKGAVSAEDLERLCAC
jgi:hypothetical protein